MRSVRIAEFNKQQLITLAVWLVGLCVAWTVGHWVADGQTHLLIFAAVGFVLLVIALVILHNWRAGFYLFLVWLLFEDLIRKYLGNNMAIFFAKDCLAALTYISLLIAIRRKHAKAFRPPFLLFLSLFFWLAVLQVFNPYSPSPFYGFLGLKVDFFYVPLIFLGYALIRDERDLHRFLLVFMFLAIAISGLGIAQGILGPSFLNPPTLQHDIRELGSLEKITPLTNQIFFLPCSVFVSSGRFALYLILAIVVGLGSAGYFVLSSLKGRMVIYAGIGTLAIAAVLSGSRSGFLFSLISAVALFAAFLWGAPWRWGRGHLVKAIRRSIVFAGFALAGLMLIFPVAAGSRLGFYSQTLLPGSSAYELSQRSWSYPIGELVKALSGPHWVVGNGTGTDTLGAQYVSEILKEPMPNVAVEEGYGQLIAEMGILAPFLWILWTAVTVGACWKIVGSLKGTRFFPIGMAILWYAFLLLFAMSYMTLDAYQNYVNNAFLWLLVGILFRLPELVRAQQIPSTSASALTQADFLK
ncbi:MAG: hypothetical protein WA876_04935 [Candidatus Acidiferrales bacterium]